jgi:predicted N-acetyltransferase YhbS
LIRLATKDDYPAIENHAEAFWLHAPFDVPYKKGSAIFYMDIAFEQGLLLVAEIGGQVVGFAAGALSPLMGNNDYLAGSELAWWVEPEHRGGRLGIQLMKGLESAARTAGCDFWSMIYMESCMPEAIERMYQKMGYVLKETTYGKRLYGKRL